MSLSKQGFGKLPDFINKKKVKINLKAYFIVSVSPFVCETVLKKTPAGGGLLSLSSNSLY